MKEFNLDEYLKNPSQKVVTKDGREVRIICTDMKSYDDDKIVTLVKKNDGEEVLLCYRKSGRDKYCPDFDLFFAPVKKEGWVNINFSVDKGKYVEEEIYCSEDEAIENSKFGIYIATVKIEWEE